MHRGDGGDDDNDVGYAVQVNEIEEKQKSVFRKHRANFSLYCFRILINFNQFILCDCRLSPMCVPEIDVNIMKINLPWLSACVRMHTIRGWTTGSNEDGSFYLSLSGFLSLCRDILADNSLRCGIKLFYARPKMM